jgi:hypothetical protein
MNVKTKTYYRKKKDPDRKVSESINEKPLMKKNKNFELAWGWGCTIPAMVETPRRDP